MRAGPFPQSSESPLKKSSGLAGLGWPGKLYNISELGHFPSCASPKSVADHGLKPSRRPHLHPDERSSGSAFLSRGVRSKAISSTPGSDRHPPRKPKPNLTAEHRESLLHTEQADPNIPSPRGGLITSPPESVFGPVVSTSKCPVLIAHDLSGFMLALPSWFGADRRSP